MSMFDFWLSPSNLPFAVAIAVMLFLAMLQIIGLGELIDSDGDGDIAGDGAVDGAFDSGLLSLLGLGRVPFLIWLMLLLLTFGIIGASGQQLMEALTGNMLSAWLAAPLAAVAALPLTGAIARPLARILPTDESSAVSPDQLVGRFAEIQIGTAAQGSPARARVVDSFGQAHNIMVEPDNAGQSFRTGEQVLLVRRERGVFKAVARGDEYLPRL